MHTAVRNPTTLFLKSLRALHEYQLALIIPSPAHFCYNFMTLSTRWSLSMSLPARTTAWESIQILLKQTLMQKFHFISLYFNLQLFFLSSPYIPVISCPTDYAAYFQAFICWKKDLIRVLIPSGSLLVATSSCFKQTFWFLYTSHIKIWHSSGEFSYLSPASLLFAPAEC